MPPTTLNSEEPFYSLVSVRGLFLAHLGLFALKDFD